MIRILISIPLLIVLVAFALSNQQPVRLGLWPTDIVLVVPVSVAVLVGAGLFFVLGAFMTWTSAVSNGARARRAERRTRELRAEIEAMRQAQVQQLREAQAPAGVRQPGQAVAMLPPG